LETPVALCIFNRPDLTARVMARLAEVCPTRLLVVADGPRPDRPEDVALCAEALRIATSPTWPGDLRANVSETNLGCRERIAGGLDWVFDEVEEAIVIEDDCLPTLSFFPFCAELLERYRDDRRIGAIVGTNLSGERPDSAESYFFSRFFYPWGWASWRRVWRDYDVRISHLDAVRDLGILDSAFTDARVRQFFDEKFSAVQRGAIDTWDFQLGFMLLAHGSLVATPSVNLVRNLGGGRADATHMTEEVSVGTDATEELEMPLCHPAEVVPFRRADLAVERICFALRIARE